MRWLDVPGYEGLYQVSRSGQIFGLTRKRVLAHFVDESGYCRVNLYRDGQVRHHKVHRLVAAAFLGPIPEGYQINHKDGDKSNNAVSNLEAVTPKENVQHAEATGLKRSTKGEGSPRAKLTEAKVREMRRLHKEGFSASKLAKLYGVSQRMACLICSGRAWRHVA